MLLSQMLPPRHPTCILGQACGDSIQSLPKTCCFIDSPFYPSNVDGMDDVWNKLKQCGISTNNSDKIFNMSWPTSCLKASAA